MNTEGKFWDFVLWSLLAGPGLFHCGPAQTQGVDPSRWWSNISENPFLRRPVIFFFKILFFSFILPKAPLPPPVHSCIFFIVGPSSCSMWDAASAWFDEQCHVSAQDSNQWSTGLPAAENVNLTAWPRGQPLKLSFYSSLYSIFHPHSLLIFFNLPFYFLILWKFWTYIKVERMSIISNKKKTHVSFTQLHQQILTLALCIPSNFYFFPMSRFQNKSHLVILLLNIQCASLTDKPYLIFYAFITLPLSVLFVPLICQRKRLFVFWIPEIL